MIKKALAVLTSAMITVSAVCAGGISASAASGATGVGLAEHAMEAYYEDWSYVYGGSSEGAVDCSGLFVTYYGVGGNRTNLVGSASEVGYVSNGIPRIHGLGLWQPGHVGIYAAVWLWMPATKPVTWSITMFPPRAGRSGSRWQV